MAILKDTMVSSTTYNSLPHIGEVLDVPKDESESLEILRALLVKHNTPSGVSIRLIHKHYDTEEGEVMAFKRLTVPSYGPIEVMQPVSTTNAFNLKGLHYFVDNDGSLQAYEYTSHSVADLSDYQPFVREFCRTVKKMGLQHKFGIKLRSGLSNISCTEFEFPAQKSTILIPEGLPMLVDESKGRTATEWYADPSYIGAPSCLVHCVNATHAKKPKDSDGCDGEMILGGQRVEPGTPVWHLISVVIGVW
jgi:hypothetical protein